MKIRRIPSGFKKFGILLATVSIVLLAVAPASALADSGNITGKVTDATDTPLANVRVDAYASVADYSNGLNGNAAAIAETGTDGTYAMNDVSSGAYLLVFNQGGGGHLSGYATDFYPGERSISLSHPVTVTAGATTEDINARLTEPGQITGKITNAQGAGLANITFNVYATVYDYQNGILSAGYHAGSDGTYQIGGLHQGDYIVVFNQPGNMMYQASYATQYYNGQSTIESANSVPVAAGQITSDVDAVLTALAPTSKDQCKKEGWRLFTNPTFRNQGECIRYVEHHD